jgi:hypothetical protein
MTKHAEFRALRSAGWLAVLLLAACEGPAPYDETHEGTLTDDDTKVEDDQSPFDHYSFDADEGWVITAEMRSDAFDSYLWLISPSGSSLQQDDDGLGEGTLHSRITFTAPERGTYIVRANSRDATGRGPYTVHITARPRQGSAPAE